MKLSTIALVISLSFLVESSTSQDPNTDASFLSDFFSKMGHSSISTSTSVCEWTGVTCQANTDSVTRLSLSGLGLTGPIPESTIGKLTKLELLDLSNNSITSLSLDIWELGSSLKFLNLSFNSITGSLSNNIGNFGALERLDLSHNRFTEEIPASLGSITSLSLLNLGHNRFNGSFPDAILGCKTLVFIDLSDNLLEGSVPNDLGNALKSLKVLNLGGNRINGRLPDISGLVSLTYLNLSSNSIQELVPAVFHQQLETIDLSNNQFQGHIPFVNLTSLVYLDMSMNEITGQFSDGLDRFGSLKHLNLAFNKFSFQSFPSVGKLSGLEYLNLSNTSLTGQIPSDFSQLASLKTLDLSQNYISGQIPDFSVEDLQIIDVSINNLTGQIPEPLEKKIPDMQKFNFSYNNLTVCGPHWSLDDYSTAFIGSHNDCPIAVNPGHMKNMESKRKRLGLILSVSLSALCLFLGLVCLLLGLRKRSKPMEVKQVSFNKEENSMSGPFSFQTDSTTWVADVKLATSVPVIIFDKPLVNFTFSDLLAATSNFDRGTLLAEGRFGPVYRGFLQGGIQVAVKVLVHGWTMTDQDAERELERLGRIRHPNLVPLTGYCLAGDQRIAIYEYMENGNLYNLLHDLPLGVQSTEDWSSDTWEEDENGDNMRNVQITPEGTATWRFRHIIALGTARALAFLHHGCIPQIVHRDVKASSIYLDDSMEPRLADFGLSMIAGTNPDEEISNGSPGYKPPEFSDTVNPSAAGVTTKSDVYGFGVVLFELLTGKKPLGDDYPDSKENILVGWARAMVKIGHGSSIIDPKIRDTGSEKEMEEALRIGYLCTADLPSKRPAMQQIVGLLKDIEPKTTKD
ncbi:Leucine-rich repeat protein kinase family protein [Rhynchospora pubera]|uniref:Leucine-rich repeat protein kinase family protein n=1 Tax=Rhynchospora pubera TaxID=906938 RepID=A0AAV8CGW0_9POAL|nr:Leucine-rich repeat protein kinase family protein [Rhynchospora pubera]